MRNTMIKILFLTLLLIVVIPQDFVSACDISQLQKIYFQRKLPENAKELEVHCKFGNEDLKNHVLRHSEEYMYEFCKGSVEKKLSCFLRWGNKKREFDAFVDLPKSSPILESLWSARVNGIHLSDSAGNAKFLLWE